MKKQQKIIELRTAAKLNVAKIETKLAFARSEAAGNRARLMWERAAELDGLDACSTERYDVLAKYQAKLASVNERLAATVAQLKFEIQQTKNECERQCADADDDPDQENQEQENPEQDNDQPTVWINGEPTVWINGEQWTAAVVAHRILNKLPHIPYGCSIDISLDHYSDGGITLCFRAYNPKREKNMFESVWLREYDEAEKQAADASDWLERAERLIAYTPDNDHVAEPIGQTLDSFFGGNPVSKLNEIVDGVVRKEADNE